MNRRKRNVVIVRRRWKTQSNPWITIDPNLVHYAGQIAGRCMVIGGSHLPGKISFFRAINAIVPNHAIFPLETGSSSLMPEETPNGRERPLLIDPMAENGVEHIQFVLEMREGKELWIPQPRKNSSRGDWTINVCGLDQDGLVTQYTAQVSNNVMPSVREIQQHNGAPGLKLKRAVARVCARLLNSQQKFVGLSYDALIHYTGADLAQHNYVWPMPT